MKLLGIQQGDEVLLPSFTFCASANAVIYEGGIPVFIDSEERSWNIDPNLLEEELHKRNRNGNLPKAVMSVDLYGQCADYNRIQSICKHYDIPLIEDAAEALGATYGDRKAGVFGKLGVFSFNGNKIITTSGGGMLVSDNAELIERARFLSTQARDAAPYYLHTTIGYNYRLSNLLAAVGRGQLRVLPQRVAARRANIELYRNALADLPGIQFMPEAQFGYCTRWLTCITIDAAVFGADTNQVRNALEAENIEARPVWKPLHTQPVYGGLKAVGGEVSERIFKSGLCLPSGSSLTSSDIERIVKIIRRMRKE
jgi:pyridoxal phosphate-dependent aminotransferase EpsN